MDAEERRARARHYREWATQVIDEQAKHALLDLAAEHEAEAEKTERQQGNG
jgi:hypothetical protein